MPATFGVSTHTHTAIVAVTLYTVLCITASTTPAHPRQESDCVLPARALHPYLVWGLAYWWVYYTIDYIFATFQQFFFTDCWCPRWTLVFTLLKRKILGTTPAHYASQVLPAVALNFHYFYLPLPPVRALPVWYCVPQDPHDLDSSPPCYLPAFSMICRY